MTTAQSGRTSSQTNSLQPSMPCNRPASVPQKRPRNGRPCASGAGSMCRVWINSRQVIKADLDKLAEKVKNVPGLKRTGGFIGLQNHSSPVFYRNIRIKELKQMTPPDQARKPQKNQ